jgi:hypothetical protein
MPARGLKHLVGGQTFALKAEIIAGPGEDGVPTDAEMDAVEAVGGPDRERALRGGRFRRIFIDHGAFEYITKARQ